MPFARFKCCGDASVTLQTICHCCNKMPSSLSMKCVCFSWMVLRHFHLSSQETKIHVLFGNSPFAVQTLSCQWSQCKLEIDSFAGEWWNSKGLAEWRTDRAEMPSIHAQPSHEKCRSCTTHCSMMTSILALSSHSVTMICVLLFNVFLLKQICKETQKAWLKMKSQMQLNKGMTSSKLNTWHDKFKMECVCFFTNTTWSLTLWTTANCWFCHHCRTVPHDSI